MQVTADLNLKSTLLKCVMLRGILLPFHNAQARDTDMVPYALMGNEKATLKDFGKVQFTQKI